MVLALVLVGLPVVARAQDGADERVQDPGTGEDQSQGELTSKPVFPEDRYGTSDGWTFGFHGYARMPLRWEGSPVEARPPYLVDDDYYLSGFAYTRVNESEWAEIFFNVHKGDTRAVVGLFASEFSDWSQTTLQGQGGIATAFVEHTFRPGECAELGVRAGMFWDRHGWSSPYDTYLLGRMHVAGLRLRLRLFDLWTTQAGFGAHADVINANQGFTPVAWLKTGVDLGWARAGFFVGNSWTRDSQREFAIIENGNLRVIGGEGRVTVPWVGPLALVVSMSKANNALFLANAFEIMHSTGGRGLTQNYFGPDADNGTGEIFAGALDLAIEPHRAVEALASEDAARRVRGLSIRLFGMLAHTTSKQASANPLENFHDRTYFKWGIEPFYRPPWHGWRWLFVSLRYDRVILDTDHESMSFRVITPRVGISPLEELDMDIFMAWSHYVYGENVRLRPNQIPGDLSVTRPDGDVFKLQAQVSW